MDMLSNCFQIYTYVLCQPCQKTLLFFCHLQHAYRDLLVEVQKIRMVTAHSKWYNDSILNQSAQRTLWKWKWRLKECWGRAMVQWDLLFSHCHSIHCTRKLIASVDLLNDMDKTGLSACCHAQKINLWVLNLNWWDNGIQHLLGEEKLSTSACKTCPWYGKQLPIQIHANHSR